MSAPFKDKIRQFSAQLNERLPQIQGEEATKHSCILPLLQILEFDVWNPLEVKPEYSSDFVTKSKAGPVEKVDYCLKINGEPSYFIECKALKENLNKHTAQLSRYYNATPDVKVAILTNGAQYKFYTDTLETNILDSLPFFEWTITDLTDDTLDILVLFSKTKYNKSTIKNIAERAVEKDRIEEYLSTLTINPSDNFIKLVITELNLSGRCTDKIIEKYREVVKNILSKNSVVLMDKVESKIITTEEELQIFSITKNICGDDTITYKDTINYFSILVGKNWFLKAYCNSSKKHIILRVPTDYTVPEEFLFTTEQTSSYLKIYFSSSGDLKYMRDVIKNSYNYSNIKE
jgi:hypothetical protein